MYAVGENFGYTMEEEELDISVIGEIMMFGDEYLIGEDEDGIKYAFKYIEDEETVEMIEDEDEARDVMDNWEEEYYAGGTDIGDWDDDSYYEREDRITPGSTTEREPYFEEDTFSEAEEDVDSFLTGMLG